MEKSSFEECFRKSRFLLTEGAVGQRVEREFGFKPDPDVFYAGLIYEQASRKALETIYRQYLQVAEDFSLPILLMTNTRRANRERMERSAFAGRDVMHDYMDFLRDLSAEYACRAYVGGMLGCRGDAYRGDEGLTLDEAVDYHSWQVERLGAARPDFLYAALLPCMPEAMGIARAGASGRAVHTEPDDPPERQAAGRAHDTRGDPWDRQCGGKKAPVLHDELRAPGDPSGSPIPAGEPHRHGKGKVPGHTGQRRMP